MKRKLAVLMGAALTLALGGTALAASPQQTGTGNYPPTPVAGATAVVGVGASAQVGTGAGVGMGAGAGASAGTGMTTSTGMTMGSTANTGGTGFYSTTNRPGVVPSGAGEVSRVAAAGGATTVTYSSGGRFYNVTYYPSGRYTYTVTGSAMANSSGTGMAAGGASTTMGGSSMTAGGSGMATGMATGGASMLPRTGGANPGSPSPTIPALLGLGLAAAGLTLRRMTKR